MARQPRSGPVVVGVDGSVGSIVAAEWAADEADRLGSPLRLVHGYVPPVPYRFVFPEYDLDVAPVREHAEQVLAKAAQHVRARHPATPVSTTFVTGDPVPVLVGESGAASVVVVGTRGAGGFAGLLTGSVSAPLAAHARCPVVVVPPGAGRIDPQAPVAVGVDGSVESADALAYAFDAAAAAHVPLVAVHVRQAPLPLGVGQDRIRRHPSTGSASEAGRLLDEQLEAWRAKLPDVQVETRIASAHSVAEPLIDASRAARLVVVGCRGRGGFSGLLLGSVSRALVNHAACPTMVVHHHQGPGPARSGS